MYHIYQYNEQGFANLLTETRCPKEAVKICRKAENDWKLDKYGAAFITLNSTVIGDSSGIFKDTEPLNVSQRTGSILTGRESL